MARKFGFSNELPACPFLMGPGIGGEQFARCRFRSGSEKRSFLVEYHMNGDVRQQFLKLLFFAEGGQKFAVLDLGQNLGRDATRDEDAPACKRLKRQVAGFGAV
jgi:hypothetical protein